MGLPVIHGSDVAALANASLGGYQNALDQVLLYGFLNEGKNEIWMILKEEKANWFATTSEYADNTQLNYFGPLNPSSRQYTLPADMRELKFIEVEDVGFEDVRFEYRPISHPDWQDARRANTNANSNPDAQFSNDVYYWDIIGKDQFVMAQFPQQIFHMTLFYIRIIPDFGANDLVDEVLYPFVQKIAEYAVKKAMLSLQDQPMSQAWIQQWRDSVMRVVESSSDRQSADPLFVADFFGYSIEQ